MKRAEKEKDTEEVEKLSKKVSIGRFELVESVFTSKSRIPYNAFDQDINSFNDDQHFFMFDNIMIQQ